MLDKLMLTFFIIITILSFYIPLLWMLSTLIFSLGVIELYFDKKTIEVLK